MTPPPPPPLPSDCDNDGTPNSSDSSSDIDLLSDSLERSLRTDPCDADTDDDGAEDGFEYRSALDLNHYPRTPPLPFPGTRPYPNALDPTDGNIDYDGDSLTVREEYLLWFRYAGDGDPAAATRRVTSPTRPSGPLQRRPSEVARSHAPRARRAAANWALDQDDNGPAFATTSATATATA